MPETFQMMLGERPLIFEFDKVTVKPPLLCLAFLANYCDYKPSRGYILDNKVEYPA